MRRIIPLLTLVILTVRIASAQAIAAAPLLLTVRAGEPAPVDATAEQMFIFVDVYYRGAAPLQLIPDHFRLVDAAHIAHMPRSYLGPEPLQRIELETGAETSGWLLFSVKPDAAHDMSLQYEQDRPVQGIAQVVVLGHTSPFTPLPNAARTYATRADGRLRTYLVDEADAAAFSRAADATFEAGSVSAAMLRDARTYLHGQRAHLVKDHAAFDRIAAEGAAASAWKAHADAALGAIESDLQRVLAVRDLARWTSWYGAFSRHDRALAGLYQQWPGAQ